MRNWFDRHFRKLVSRRAKAGQRMVGKMEKQELAEIISYRGNEPVAELARSRLRIMESWQSPDKWLMILAIGSLVVAAVALFRTF
jgi:hypothetical protein